jgi:XTP/dITP diphosphohydrolase
LCVHALDNAPGIYTARYAKENGGYSKGMKRLGEGLRNKGSCDSTAHFVCVLALASPDGEELTFRGEVNGHLEFPERGTNGFGFDPIFVMEGMDQTYGEIPQLLKDKINHRAQAFEKLVAGLRLKAGH